MEYGVFVCNFNRIADMFLALPRVLEIADARTPKTEKPPRKRVAIARIRAVKSPHKRRPGGRLSCTPLSSNNAFRLRHLGFPDLVRRGRPDRADADFCRRHR